MRKIAKNTYLNEQKIKKLYIYLYKRDPEVVLNTGAKENDDAMNSFKTTAIIRLDKYSIWAFSGQRRC